MVHTVGIAGINGNVGKPTAKFLAQAASENKIKLVIFHREGSKVDNISASSNVEFRPLNFEDPVEKIEEAIKGINVFISAVGFSALPHEPKLVSALSKSPDLITYIPSTYSTTWNSSDFAHPQLGPILSLIHGGWDRAKENGIGITSVYVGVFDLYWFEYGFVGSPIKENKIWANEAQLRNRVPITSMTHLAQALTRIATADPQTTRNKSYSVVTFWPSGEELLGLYTKVNGKKAEVKPWTKEDRESFYEDGPNFGPAKAGYWDKWEADGFAYEKEGRIVEGEYEGPGLEEIARRFV